MLYILNAPVLTDFGTFRYSQLSLEEVKALISANEWTSAVGHLATARIISELLDIKCTKKRVEYRQNIGEIAIVFVLNERAKEGAILTKDEVEGIGYSWGLLIRTE